MPNVTRLVCIMLQDLLNPFSLNKTEKNAKAKNSNFVATTYIDRVPYFYY